MDILKLRQAKLKKIKVNVNDVFQSINIKNVFFLKKEHFYIINMLQELKKIFQSCGRIINIQYYDEKQYL